MRDGDGAAKVLFIQNCEAEGLGLYGTLLAELGASVVTVHPYRGEPFPPLHPQDLVIVGGTPIFANRIGEHSFLHTECQYLRTALARRMPILGVGFGGQSLARLLGATVHHNPVTEIGGYAVALTAEGTRDPLFRGFPDRFPVFHWHGDTFDVPPGAKLLVEGQDCRKQCFRCGNVVAVQFHLEVRADDAARWADAYSDELEAVGKTREQVIAECREREREMARLARLLMNRLVRGVRLGRRA